MANILRTIVFHSKCRGLRGGGGGGILQSSLGSQKLSSFVPNLFLNSLIKCSTVNSAQRQASTFYDFKYTIKPDNRSNYSKFEELHLNRTNFSEMKEGLLVNTFQKMFNVYEKNKHRRNFQNDVKQFSSSKGFINFCNAVDKMLPTLSPNSLIILIDLSHFIEPETSCLMQKLTKLILDNFNRFLLFDIVYLYSKCSESAFSDNIHWKNVKKACEVYFKECFKLHLTNCNFSEELLTIVDLEVLPKSIRQSVAKKLLNDAYLNSCNQKEMTLLLRVLCISECTLVSRDELLRLIKKSYYTVTSNSLLILLTASYTTLLERDDSYYDEEIMNLLVSSGFQKLNTLPKKIQYIYSISQAGYYEKEFVTFVCSYLRSSALRTIDHKLSFEVVSILTRYSFHETEPEENVRAVRKILNGINFENMNTFPAICTACEFLTYLGCDTRNLCSKIFTTVMESATPVSEKNILTLHHLAKAYHNSSGYQVLPEELVKVLLADEFKQFESISRESLAPYFGSEDYVLKNCTTADKHCLHFVSLFGADNKPISLSAYEKKQLKLPYGQFLKIEDIKRPRGSKMVAFQIFPKRQPVKFLNEPSLTGIAKMNLKMFENLDCSIVFLPEKFFTFAPEAKEKFLRMQINEVIGNSESLQSTGRSSISSEF